MFKKTRDVSPGAITMNTTDMNHVQVACNNTGLYAKEGYSWGIILINVFPTETLSTVMCILVVMFGFHNKCVYLLYGFGFITISQ